jgi:hypothetical protein
VIQIHLIKKIIRVGKSSKGIIIPKSWLIFHEKKNRKKISKIGMEINGKIVIWPILKEWE